MLMIKIQKPELTSRGLMYGSGALAETWAKLMKVRTVS
jgi:hypothetical protein